MNRVTAKKIADKVNKDKFAAENAQFGRVINVILEECKQGNYSLVLPYVDYQNPFSDYVLDRLRSEGYAVHDCPGIGKLFIYWSMG